MKEKETTRNLRGYKNILILKKISSEVMLLGLPLKLAYIYIGCILVASMTAMILANIGVGFMINILIPAIIAFGGIAGIKTFHKKYGTKGFALQQRDFSITSEIEGDITIVDALKNLKNKKNKSVDKENQNNEN